MDVDVNIDCIFVRHLLCPDDLFRLLSSLVSNLLFLAALFAALYGIRYTFRISDLLNLVFMCLAFIHYRATSNKTR